MHKEQRLWQLLRSGLGRFGHWHRIENIVGDGTPDVNYAMSGAEGWLELKCIESIPARKDTQLFGLNGLRPEQIEWLVARSRHGRAFIFARASDHIFLVPGRHAPVFNAATLSRLKELSVFYHQGRMVRSKWQQLGDALVRKDEHDRTPDNNKQIEVPVPHKRNASPV